MKVQINDLQQIPGVGKSIAADLLLLNIHSVKDLIGKDPETMYKDLCLLSNASLDKCLLYVFRCAVYYAEENQHEPEKLKWWYWKGINYQSHQTHKSH